VLGCPESTYWNPSWTLARGAVETTDIADMTRTAMGIGSGRLLTRKSHREQINPHLSFGHPQAGCERCTTLSRLYGYGLGVVHNGSWILSLRHLPGAVPRDNCRAPRA
jgi:hypothetical protein